MKQFLRLWASYGLKRTQPEYLLCLQSLLKVRYILTGYVAPMLRKRTCTIVHYHYFTRTLPVLETRSSFPRTFFSLFPTIFREFIGAQEVSEKTTDTSRIRHAGWQNKIGGKSGAGVPCFRKARPSSCVRPPSLIPHSCPIPVISLYTSVKTPKDGTLPKGTGQTYGKNAHSGRQRIAQGSDRGHAGDRLGSASELGLVSELTRSTLVLVWANQGSTESKPRPNEDQIELRSHTEEYPAENRNAVRSPAAWDWFEYSRVLVRQLLTIASAFSRSVAEGLSKASRTIVEALSKDCRTSLEQQSNNCRRNIEESCVCTHAKVPARRGLGLALGLVVLLFVAMGKQGFAQESFSVSGKVISAASGVAIEGATVTNNRTGIHTVTDRVGEYRISAKQDDILSYSHVGYITVEERINDRKQISVVLDASESMLEEVEVLSTGYQRIPKERATGSFVHVDNQLLNRRVSANIVERLEGVVSGVLFNKNTSMYSLGNDDVSIRGTSSLFANQSPLIVVDGFPYEGNLSGINPNDVQDITVLKDAAAASIWGVRSGNGVIVINTKSGQKTRGLVIDFNSNAGIGQSPNIRYSPYFISAGSFIDLERGLYDRGYYSNDLGTGFTVVSPVVEILASDLAAKEKDAEIDRLRQFDVRDQIKQYFLRPSFSQQYSLGANGGGTHMGYAASLGYDDDKSHFTGNIKSRLTLNSRLDFYPTEKLSVTVGMNIARNSAANNSPLVDFNSGGGKGRTLYPYAVLVDNEGRAAAIPHDYSMAYAKTVTETMPSDWLYRPYDELSNQDRSVVYRNTRLNFLSRYQIVEGLYVELNYLNEQQQGVSDDYFNEESYYTRNLINRFFEPNSGMSRVPAGGILNRVQSRLDVHRGRWQAGYTNRLGVQHDISGLLGTEVSQRVLVGSANSFYGFSKETMTVQQVDPTAYYPTNPSGAYQQIPALLSMTRSTERTVSYYGNVAYSYGGKYTLSLSGRIDKSNLFGVNTNNQAVPLYSAGLMWDLTRERGFDRFDWLDLARLKFTFGYNGNVDKSLTGVTTIRYSNGSLNHYSGLPYASIANAGNPDLRWERVKIFNLGLDFQVFGGILLGTVEVYSKTGTDLIGDSPLPPSTGLAAFRGNTADIKGRGVEIALTSRNIDRESFRWATNFIFNQAVDLVKTYAKEQTVNTFLQAGSSIITPVVGRPVYSIFAYRWAGLDGNGNPQGYLDGKKSTDYGSIIGTTTIEDLPFIGAARPTVHGMLRNDFSYGQWHLSFAAVYKLGYFFRRKGLSYSSLFQSWGMHRDFESRWKKPGDELVTDVPAMVYPPIDGQREIFYQYSQALIEKGDHLRLQDIRVGYAFDGYGKLGSKKLKLELYAYANNLGIIWRANKAGLDPDTYDSYGAFPAPKTFSLGLKLTL